MDIRQDVPLCDYTTFRVGGAARYFCEPESIDELTASLRRARERGWEVLILGRGSNLLVSDKGYDGLTLYTGRLRGITQNGTELSAECGVPLAELAVKTTALGLKGLEWAVGIPGSVGGAVVMNAGAYGGDISAHIVSTLCFDGEDIRELDDHAFGYRRSVYLDKPSWTVLRACLRLSQGDREQLEAAAKQYREQRRLKQPVNLPSAGSFFKRPPGQYAAALIDECGLGGLSVGGAQVSELHKGFIVNTGGATCADILSLARKVRSEVLRLRGVALEPEVRLVGEAWNF